MISNSCKVLSILMVLTLGVSFSQTEDKVLLTVDGDAVKASEFLRVYNKNLDLVKDESQKDIDGYLKLFTDYQLKLKEAKRLKLDEDAKYKREFLKYKKQLTQNYISENKVTDALVEEAYERSGLDINASHVLVRLEATAIDTLKAYNDVLELRTRVLNEGFDKVKAEVHNEKTVFLEDLGYFSAFKMVYDFETAAYNTSVGEISMPFRTPFGYHVVMVKDKRPTRGTITAGHIMVALQQQDSMLDPEKRINEIYTKYKQGENFEALAKQFSDDKSSARNGGKLSPFKSGQLNSVRFEDEAFMLKKDGDVSKPFKTAYGWHIVKRYKVEPLEAFKDLKPTLENQVKRDARSKLINTAMVNELKERYQLVYTPEAKDDFATMINETFFNRQWMLPETIDKDKVLFKINDKVFTYGQFGRHLTATQRAYTGKTMPAEVVIDQEYDAFFETSILKFREENLELENEEFANILKEYRDGLLLFDLMEKEIWNKASKDTLGLKMFYNENQANYQWGERVDMVMASSAKKKVVESAKQMMATAKSEDEIKEALNYEDQQNIIFTKGIYAKSDSKLPEQFEAKPGISEIYKHNEAFHVVDVKAVLAPGPKSFEEARGMLINDYQTVLESDWLNTLKSRFKVEVNPSVLKDIKKQIENKQ